MLNGKKTTVIIFALCFLVVGCQDLTSRTNAEKQQQIATMYRQYAADFPEVAEITVAQLQQLPRESVVLVDVRSPEERAVSIIPGAISTAELERNLEQYRAATIVAYCTIGYRSGKYARKLERQGIEVLNLSGSLLSWSHAGGALVNAEGSTNKIHVFARRWQLVADDYQAVW